MPAKLQGSAGQGISGGDTLLCHQPEAPLRVRSGSCEEQLVDRVLAFLFCTVLAVVKNDAVSAAWPAGRCIVADPVMAHQLGLLSQQCTHGRHGAITPQGRFLVMGETCCRQHG